MSRTVEVRCRCGAVEGRLENAARDAVNRVVCYCDDCQAFAHQLGRADLLDEHGGSDIVQVAPASLTYQRGADRIAGLRLKPNGLYRWYATCCKTPLGNTVGPALPFVGIVAQAFGSPDELFGPPIGGLFGKYAVGTAPPGTTRPNLRLLARAVRKVVGWKLGRGSWPHPFFDRATRSPRYPVTVLSHEEREALRPRCGPRSA
ncbi:MAG TPA: DUF6151 family protein [Kofleriaceae bacterium]|nr:DUF6151 family protein [Kofleriaceae bacterium]